MKFDPTMVTAKGEFQYCIFAKKSSATLARGYLEAKLTFYKKKKCIPTGTYHIYSKYENTMKSGIETDHHIFE